MASRMFIAAFIGLGAVAFSVSAQNCAAGSVSVNGACVCDYGFYGMSISPTTGLDPNGNGCTACPDDPNTGSMLTTYDYGATSAAQCVCDGTSGFIPGATSGTCVACAAGQYGFNGQCITCSSTDSFDTTRGCICQVGFYGADQPNGGSHTCTACPTGQTTTSFPDGGATTVADCQCDPNQGYFGTAPNCQMCAAGQDVFNGQCITCGPNSVFDSSAGGCIPVSGFYGVPNADGTEPAAGYGACPAGSTSNQGATAQSQCFCDNSIGFVGTFPNCVQCAANANAFGNTCLTCTGTSQFDPDNGCVCDTNFYGPYSATGEFWHRNAQCTACPANSNAPVGTTDVSGCACDNGYTKVNGVCVLSASQRARSRRAAMILERRRVSKCPANETACPLGLFGNYECIDTMNQLDSCGGCQSIGEGRDCNKIENALGVGCTGGFCVALSCVAGFVPLGDSCVSLM